MTLYKEKRKFELAGPYVFIHVHVCANGGFMFSVMVCVRGDYHIAFFQVRSQDCAV